jgi:uncharacterized membrane-anchored protein
MRHVFWIASAMVLLTLNGLVWQKEQLLASGRMVLLDLAPRDPRSLMQGDYMELRYVVAGNVPTDAPRDGAVVLRVDPNGVASYERVYDGGPLAPNEQLLRYRRRDHNVRLGAESYFFQEGHADRYAAARYGELKVTPSGDAVLVGLRDEALTRL